jgi:hypothetical protein
MTLRRLLAPLATVCVIAAVAGFLIARYSSITGYEAATLVISLVILAVAFTTLWYTMPRAARLTIDRVDEFEREDLLFFIYPKPNPTGEREVPRDYLLQLHVAVSNLGGRKAVLSSISLDRFRTESGETIHLPESTGVIWGMQWQQRYGWADATFHHENFNVLGPYILEPDDVIVIQFRTRRGIDWSSRWTTQTLREFCKPLTSPIVEAEGEMAWRRAGEVVRERFVIPMRVMQQAEYVQLVQDLTNDFTGRPTIAEQAIQFE